MRLTYRDAIATVLAMAVVAIMLAVTRGWDWPLLGSVKAGIVALGVVGIAGCTTATRTQDMATGQELKRHPGMILGSILGGAALVMFIGGLIAGTEAWLVALAMTLIALWFVATVRHALAHEPAPGRLVTAH
jgi:hypothetical protein